MKKDIKIKFTDFWDGFDYNRLIIYDILKKKYNVIICDDPDYIIYSSFGYEHLKYNCIRIFYTAENMTPNFNQCDYGISFDYLDFGDRYIRIPNYLMAKGYAESVDLASKKHLDKENYKIRDKFCNMVVSNGLNGERVKFFHKLSNYKKVDSGGKILNNVGGPVKSKLEFQKQYKFSFAFENSSKNGYTTEKLVDAFAAGGIPIYWGDPLVSKVFNKKAFINGNDFKNFDDLIEYIKKVDNDDKLYLKYIQEPAFIDNNYVDKETKKLEAFFYNIFDQDLEKAQRRCGDNHWVIQEKKYYLLADKMVKAGKPVLKLKSKIKNKLVK